MSAWERDQKTEGSLIQLMGDPSGDFTKALGLELNHHGPQGKGLYQRCKRFSMLIKDCVVKTFNVAEGPEDPAGDDFPEVSMADKMLEDLKAKKDEL